MEDQKNLSTKTKEKMNDLKASLEHLRMQMHLGTLEAKDEFENQKKNLGKWVDKTESRISNAKGLSDDKAKKLRTSLDELKVQAALGKAETRDALKDQQQKINEGIHKLKMGFKDVSGSAEEGWNDLSQDASQKLESFQTSFDMFRVQLHLGKEEAKETWDEKKKEMSKKLDDLKFKTEKMSEATSEKLQDFSDEMSEAWSHFRKAFQG